MSDEQLAVQPQGAEVTPEGEQFSAAPDATNAEPTQTDVQTEQAQSEPTPEEIAAQKRIADGEERAHEAKDITRNIRRLDRELERLARRYDLDDHDVVEGQSADDWRRARQAQIDGTLDALRAANAQETQALMLQKNAELQKLGLVQQREQIAITPSYWDSQGNAVGPMSAPEFHEQVRAHADAEIYRERQDEVLAGRQDRAELVARAADIPATPELLDAIIRLRAPEITIHLTEHPEVAQRLCQFSGVKLAAELGALRASLAARGSETPQKQRSPKPPTPLRKPSAANTDSVYDDTLPGDRWLRARNAQLAAKGER